MKVCLVPQDLADYLHPQPTEAPVQITTREPTLGGFHMPAFCFSACRLRLPSVMAYVPTGCRCIISKASPYLILVLHPLNPHVRAMRNAISKRGIPRTDIWLCMRVSRGLDRWQSCWNVAVAAAVTWKFWLAFWARNYNSRFF